MRVPFFEYPRLWSDERDVLIDIIDRTSATGGFILQKALFDFEDNLAKYSKSKFAIGVGNATDGMEIFLSAIGLKPGDEVIISAHTMLATASAIKVAGGVPIPVDIGSDNLIDPLAIEAAISSRTVGIMPTQLNGRVCDMDAIQKIADKHGLFIVEDAAQALGAVYKGRAAGTFGLASDISFFPAKTLGCLGDAGAILCQDESLYEKCYAMHEHGRNKSGEVICWGRNSRLDNIQAAILDHKLRSFHQVIERRREVASLYQSFLGDVSDLSLPAAPGSDPDRFDTFQNYEMEAERRDEIKLYLLDKNIGTLIQWGGTAIHHFKNLGFNQHCPKTDRFFDKCIMLPMNVFISDEDVEYVACGAPVLRLLIVKRFFDVFVSLTGLIVLAPVIFCFSFAVFLKTFIHLFMWQNV